MDPRLFGIVILLVSAWILGADGRILRSLRRAGATRPEKAISLQTNNPFYKWRIGRLRTARVIHARKKGRIFLDEDAWKSFRRRRLKLTAVFVASAAAILLCWYLIFDRA